MTPDGTTQKKIRRENFLKLLVVITIITVSSVILLAIPGMLISFLLAFVVSYLFKPIISNLERRGISKTFAVLIPFLISGFIISAASRVMVNRIEAQTASFQRDLPIYVSGITELVKNRTKSLNAFLAPFTRVDLGEKAGSWMQNSTARFLDRIPELVSMFFSTLVLAPFFAFFMLRDGQRIGRGLLSLVPNNLFETALNLSYQINQQLGEFIRARLFEAIIVGFVVWLGLYSMNFPYATLLALFAGLTNLIPYLGPVIGAVPGILVAVVAKDTVASVALVTSVYFIAQLIDMIFVIPLVVARIVDLHPVTVVIVIIIGSQIMGILGMIISVPVASILKLCFTEFYNHVVDIRS